MSDKEHETTSLCNRFRAPLLEEIKEMAKRHHRSVSGKVLTIRQEHIKSHQKGK